VSNERLDPVLVQRLSNQLARGQAVLSTGAGFSMDATARGGDPIPSANDLREKLWEIAFPGEPLDDQSSLGDIFEVAVRTAQIRTRELFQASMRVDAARVICDLVLDAIGPDLHA
jgi:hypothetical protein